MAPRRRKALSPASQRRALVPEWDATKGRSAFDADAWSSDGGATPTPPPTPRKAVIGESADFHKAIAEFEAMCPTRTPVLDPHPRRAVGELKSPIYPGEKPAGGFSPPTSPPKPPAIQVALARNYPISRLNPLPNVQELLARHKGGALTQEQLWREIQALRRAWEEEKVAAEERVREQRLRRQLLCAPVEAGPSAIRGTQSAPAHLQPSVVPDPAPRPVGACDLVGDGRFVSGAQSSDQRADNILARLQALTTDSPPASPRSDSYSPSPPLSPRARHGRRLHGLSPSTSRSSSVASSRSSRSRSHRAGQGGAHSPRRAGKAVAAGEGFGESAAYQEARPGTQEEEEVELAEVTFKRLMAWAMTTAHDRHQPPVSKRRNPWAPQAPTPEPSYLKMTSDSAHPERIGSPIFPELEQETEELNRKWSEARAAVRTPTPDPVEAQMPLYFFHPITGEVVMPEDMPPDVLEEMRAELAK